MASIPPSGSLNGDYVKNRKVCATGRLFSMTHDDLTELVNACGGKFIRHPTRSNFILIVGDAGLPAEADGSPSRVLERAQKLRALGYAIDFVSEDGFLERLGLTEPAEALHGRHPISDLARILHVSPARIRRWIHVGLIEPVESTHRLAYFDFHQVALAKRLCELLDSGSSLAAIRAGMEQARSWLSDQEPAAAQLARLERDGRILFRLNNALLDGRGQRYFDFDETQAQDVAVPFPAVSAPADAADLFDQAVALEDAGQLEAAAGVYERALALEPWEPALHFNLGNVLFGLGRSEPSAACFERAVQRDPQYAEAWNNLGNVLAQLNRPDDAVEALRHAVQLVPGYADAHYNLANVLRALGRLNEAEEHWNVYQRLSSASRLIAHRAKPFRVVDRDS
jgi:tetratricopeptide (TPR) repeat protein